MTNMTIALKRCQDLQSLGQRAIDYYVDTGLCVFCDADDCTDLPHEEHCNVGDLSGVKVTPERRKAKAEERGAVEFAIGALDRLVDAGLVEQVKGEG